MRSSCIGEIPTDADRFLAQLAPYRDDVVVCVECLCTWYWVADLWSAEGIPCVLGHALEMNAISGSKTNNDRIDSRKIATLLRGGMIPMASVSPRPMRSNPRPLMAAHAIRASAWVMPL